jgi:nucleoside-diphosphate-sugar epimerase
MRVTFTFAFERYNLEVRSLRFPGLVFPGTEKPGSLTEYVTAMVREAITHHCYTCYLEPETNLSMLYVPDAVRATMELMDAPAEAIRERGSYSISGMHFSPQELADEISLHIRPLEIIYLPDYRQSIAESWPASIDDSRARADWNWKPEFNLSNMTTHILERLTMNQKILV